MIKKIYEGMLFWVLEKDGTVNESKKFAVIYYPDTYRTYSTYIEAHKHQKELIRKDEVIVGKWFNLENNKIYIITNESEWHYEGFMFHLNSFERFSVIWDKEDKHRLKEVSRSEVASFLIEYAKNFYKRECLVSSNGVQEDTNSLSEKIKSNNPKIKIKIIEDYKIKNPDPEEYIVKVDDITVFDSRKMKWANILPEPLKIHK